MLLNDLKCKNAAPREKSYKLADGAGLYLEITPSGGKHWKYKYRFDGKERKLSIGSYPLFTLVEARLRRNDATAKS
jgi:Arm DNA-binding domain